jgi:HAE1 family hydrophobic/amphiphilic exporter-1
VGGFVGGAVLLSYATLPEVEYLPSGNRNLVFGLLLPPPGYNMDQLLAMGEVIEDHTRRYWDLDPYGPEARDLDFPAVRDFFFVAFGRGAFLGLRAADPLRAGELIPLIRDVENKVPGTHVVAKQSSLFERGLGAGRTIDIEIAGPELTTLVDLGRQVLRQVKEIIPDVQTFPRPSLDLSNPELHIRPKLEMAANMGVTNVDLGYAVDALVDGAYATDYFIGGDKIDLTIIGEQRFARRTQDIEQLPIVTPSGDLVPLAALADVRLGSGPEQINHRERQRAITIGVTPPPEIALEEAMNRITGQIIDPMVADGRIGGQYQINLSGTADKLRATWKALRFNVLLALLITYLLMAALFESWLYPFVIIFSVPLGAVGGFLGLWVLNRFILQPLDVLTMLGFVILIGTSVNNAILIVHQALNHMRDEAMPMRQAILESVSTRIRPIFMTTSTTVLALLPLIIFPGAGSELYRGLGSVILGGLVVSTVLTLFLVPSLFTLTMGAKEKLIRFFGVGDQQDDQQAPPPERAVAS